MVLVVVKGLGMGRDIGVGNAGCGAFGGGEAGPDACVAGEEAADSVYFVGAGEEIEAGATFLIPSGRIVGTEEVGESGVGVGEGVLPEGFGVGVVGERFGVDDADDGAAAEDDEFHGIDGKGAVWGGEMEEVDYLDARAVDVDGAEFAADGEAGEAGG
jgi:hypothetical protein